MVPNIAALLLTPEGILGSIIAIGIILERLTVIKKKKVYRRKR